MYTMVYPGWYTYPTTRVGTPTTTRVGIPPSTTRVSLLLRAAVTTRRVPTLLLRAAVTTRRVVLSLKGKVTLMLLFVKAALFFKGDINAPLRQNCSLLHFWSLLRVFNGSFRHFWSPLTSVLVTFSHFWTLFYDIS